MFGSEFDFSWCLHQFLRVAELAAMTAKADEERKRRPSYRAIIEHDGLPRQPSSNEVSTKLQHVGHIY